MNFNKELQRMDKGQLLGMACNFIKSIEKMDLSKNGDLITKMQAVVSEISQRKDIDLQDDFIPVWKSANGHPQTMSNVEIMKSLTDKLEGMTSFNTGDDLVKAAYELSPFTDNLPDDTKTLVPTSNKKAMDAMLEMLGTTPTSEPVKQTNVNKSSKANESDSLLDFINENQDLLKRL